jgi:tetratricopeptide (TPR) repeat protein
MSIFSKFKSRYTSAQLMLDANQAHDQGDYQRAANLLEEMLRIDPTRTEALTNLGNAYEKLNRLDEAEKAHRDCLANRPNNHLAWTNLGVVYERQGKQDAAMECYLKATEVNPNFWGAWMKLGLAYRKRQDHQQAVVSFKHAIAANAGNWRLWALISEDYEKVGENRLAQEALIKANSLKNTGRA